MQEYISKPDTNTPEIDIPVQLKALLGHPPLLQGEDPELYRGLLAAVIEERKPKTFQDWVDVYDEVTKLWEEQRLRRASAELLRGEMLNALKYYLRQISADRDLEKLGDSTELPFKYFSNDQTERQQLILLLEKYGITPAVLQAKAAQTNSDAVQMFEAMITTREKSRRKLRKDDERLRWRGQDTKKPEKE